MPSFDEVLGEMLDRSCVEVFGEVERQPGLPPGSVAYGHVAVVGFAGLAHRGHVGIALPMGAARRLHPFGGEGCTDGMVSDYVGELVNLLLGRVKAQFERYGLEVQAGTPVVLRGVDLSIHPCGDGRITGCRVLTGGSTLRTWIDVLTPEDITFPIDPIERVEEPPEPGDLWMF